MTGQGDATRFGGTFPRMELTVTIRRGNAEPPESRKLKAVLDQTYPGIDRWLKAQVAELLEGE